MSSAARAVRDVYRRLAAEVDELRFGPPVTHVYNPAIYAAATFEQYLDYFADLGAETLLLGMNPGPWGMTQTGVPFGDVEAVRTWMGLDATIQRPAAEHPRRPILGLASTRREVSGTRLWGWAAERFGSPKRFFGQFLVLNYCPLTFLEESGRNRTPEQLPAEERYPLLALCDRALAEVVGILRPRFVVGVGGFAESAARRALDSSSTVVGRILHPSPASPRANRGWAEHAEEDLLSLGIQVR